MSRKQGKIKVKIVEEVQDCLFRAIGDGRVWLCQVSKSQAPLIKENLGKIMILTGTKYDEYFSVHYCRIVSDNYALGQRRRTATKLKQWRDKADSFQAQQNLNLATGHHRSGDRNWDNIAIAADALKREIYTVDAKVRRLQENKKGKK